jgi:hypothetical protein
MKAAASAEQSAARMAAQTVVATVGQKDVCSVALTVWTMVV